MVKYESKDEVSRIEPDTDRMIRFSYIKKKGKKRRKKKRKKDGTNFKRSCNR